MLVVMKGLTFVGRYRYDGLYIVDSVSVILARVPLSHSCSGGDEAREARLPDVLLRT